MGCLQGGELAVRRTVGWFTLKAACTAVNIMVVVVADKPPFRSCLYGSERWLPPIGF